MNLKKHLIKKTRKEVLHRKNPVNPVMNGVSYDEILKYHEPKDLLA